ncbi:MAG: UDP-N-acetylmuramoyl-L-alanine--D-glutamate ligase, partial [Chloroflexota bacterium]|nr:UDP-N-acetylmuramoyl-L-alanine--D-glutamate ligase [Chloroflexota bacterium]
TDLRGDELLQPQIAELADLDIRFALGGHDERDFTEVDAVVRNPAVRRSNPYLAAARAAGVPVEMEMTIFLRACPARVIGITGTKGKTTTSALCGVMLRAGFPETVVAGNMGISALGQLAGITASTPVVLEISSWQLEAMDELGICPAIAVLTNISEDHLDTYADFAEYADTKRSIARHQRSGDVLILNADDPEVARTRPAHGVRVIGCGTSVDAGESVRIAGDHLHSTVGGREGEIAIPQTTALRGAHQRTNAALAAAAALARGASLADVEAGLRAFAGVENRMELVAEIDGVLFVNDTAATAPAAAIASLQAWGDRRIHLIAGGADKRLGFGPLAQAIARHASSVTLLDGTATPLLARELLAAGWQSASPILRSMDDAVALARSRAKSGDVVLLSPGCASFGLFQDEFDRGRQFRRAVTESVVEVTS